MTTIQKPTSKEINSILNLGIQETKTIAFIKYEVLEKMANIPTNENELNASLYCIISKDLEKYIDADIVSEIWYKEDFKLIYEKGKLKLNANKNLLINKIIDICRGYHFTPDRFTFNTKEYTYNEFIKKIKIIKASIQIARTQETKRISKIDEETNSVLFKHYMLYKSSLHSKKYSFNEFCDKLIKICDEALQTKEEIFNLSYITIDLDLIEDLNMEKMILFIAFSFLQKEKASNYENLEEWQLIFLKNLYEYVCQNEEMKNLYAPFNIRESGKIQMESMITFLNEFNILLKNEAVRKKIKLLNQKENPPTKTVKKQKKIEKIPSNKITGIEEIFTISLILNGNQTIKEKIESFDIFSKNHTLLTDIKNNYFYSLFSKIPFLKQCKLEELVLDIQLNKNGELNITINYLSLINTLLKRFNRIVDFSNCNERKEQNEKFVDELSNYGELLSLILEGKENNEEVYQTYLNYKKEIEDVPYDLYLTRVIDSILELLDSFSLLKEISTTNLECKNINDNIDKDKYYLSIAYNMFIRLYNQVTCKEKINKAEYLFLARYIEILKEIIQDGYEVQIDAFSCQDLISRYTEFTKSFNLYDLNNTNLYNAISNNEMKKTLLANWTIIPKGNEETIRYPRGHKTDIEKKNITYSYKYAKILERKYFLDHTDYECIILGVDTFKGYIGYKYKNGIIILEKFFKDQECTKPELGNATYVLNQTNFIMHSSKSKTELIAYMKSGHSDVKRPTHTSTWKKQIMDIINNWGYNANTLESIDALIEKSKKRRDGRRLEWKN